MSIKKALFPAVAVLAVLTATILTSACSGKGKTADEGQTGKSTEVVGEVINEVEDEVQGDAEPEEKAPIAAEPEEKPIIDLTQISDEQIRQAWAAALMAFTFNPFPFYDNYGFFEMRGEGGALRYGLGRVEELSGGDMRANGEVLGYIIREAYRQGKKGKEIGVWLQPLVQRAASAIAQPAYARKGWDGMVRQLLVAYDDIAARNAFGEVYKAMADVAQGEYDEMQQRWYPASSAYDEITKFARDRKFRAFIIRPCQSEYNADVGEVNRTAVVWAYSFWGRRHHENPANVKPIAATLRNLHKHMYADEAAAAEKGVKIGTKCAETVAIPSNATALPPKGSGGVLPDGNIAAQYGTAWYKFTTTGSAEYYVFWDARSTRFGADHLADVMVEVYDTQGKLLNRSRSDSGKYDGSASFTLNGGETFYIRVIRVSETGSAFKIHYDDCTGGCG